LGRGRAPAPMRRGLRRACCLPLNRGGAKWGASHSSRGGSPCGPAAADRYQNMLQEIGRSIAKGANGGGNRRLLQPSGIAAGSDWNLRRGIIHRRAEADEPAIRMALGAGRWAATRESQWGTMLVFGARPDSRNHRGRYSPACGQLHRVLPFGLTAANLADIVGAVLLIVVVALAPALCLRGARNACGSIRGAQL
jgi:hypothetical protein